MELDAPLAVGRALRAPTAVGVYCILDQVSSLAEKEAHTQVVPLTLLITVLARLASSEHSVSSGDHWHVGIAGGVCGVSGAGQVV